MAKFTKTVLEIGGSVAITLPPEIAAHIEVKVGDKIILEDKEKGKGKFVAFWKE